MSVEPGERGRLVCLLQQVVDEQFEILSLPAERDDADISDAGASAVVRPVIMSLFSPCWGPSFFQKKHADTRNPPHPFGTIGTGYFDEIPEKLQMAFDPPPPLPLCPCFR